MPAGEYRGPPLHTNPFRLSLRKLDCVSVPPQNSRKTPIGRRFKPGQSGNKGGRPKGFAKQIREMSVQGLELIVISFAVMRGVLSLSEEQHAWLKEVKDADERETLRKRMLLCAIPSISERMDAKEWLRTCGWGKAPESVMEDPISEMTDAALWEALTAEVERRREARSAAEVTQ